MSRRPARLAAVCLAAGPACVLLTTNAGCDGGTVVIADNSRPAPRQTAPGQPAPRQTAPPAAARREAPRQPAQRRLETRRDGARRERPPAPRSGGDGRPADDRLAAGDAGLGDPADVEPPDEIGPPATADRVVVGRGFGSSTGMTVDEALAVLGGPADAFEKADALKALAAAPADDSRRDEVNALLGRTLMGSLEGSGTDAADHVAAMMRWAGEPAAFRKIGEAAVLAGGPWAGREVLRRAALMEDPDAVHALTPLLRDRWAGREAVEVVRRLGEKAEPAVLPLLADGDAAVRRDAATLLGTTGGPDAAEALLKRAGAESDGSLARHMRSVRADILRRLRASGR